MYLDDLQSRRLSNNKTQQLAQRKSMASQDAKVSASARFICQMTFLLESLPVAISKPVSRDFC